MTTGNQTSHDVGFFMVDPSGNIFYNPENLPLESLLEIDKFKHFDNLMRFAFDPRTNGIYIQDGKIWHLHTTTGDDDAWDLLNSALKYIKQEFNVVPKLFFGEPPNTAEERKLSQYKPAWNEITEYIKTEMNTDPKDLSVIEYIPAEYSTDTISFSAVDGKIANIDFKGPAILVNRAMGSFNQPDYGRVNHLLVREYLRNLEQIDPNNYAKHHSDDELFFAIWKNDTTKIFKANEQQKHRLLDEESLRAEPSLGGYKGPLIIFYFEPKFNRLKIVDSDPETLSGYETSKQMLEDVIIRMARLFGANESNVTLNHDDFSNKPFISKLSKHSIVWDMITDFCEDVGIKAQDLPIIYSPLTRDGSLQSLLVENLEDEEKIPLEREMRINHGVQLSYPYIAVDSRISSKGLKYHHLIEEYAKVQPEIQNLPIADLFFNSDDDPPVDFSLAEERTAILDYMSYMLEYGLNSKTILDFFAPRDKIIKRAMFSKLLKEAIDKHGFGQVSRYPIPMSKAASLDIGINDWYHIGSQEALNRSAHENDPEAKAEHSKDIKPYNRKNKKPQFAEGKNNLEGLLNKQHDRELGYMKSTEQLLGESRV